MVFGLSKINIIKLYKGCVYGKQTRKPFPVDSAWIAISCIELIHADLCELMQMKSLGRSK